MADSNVAAAVAALLRSHGDDVVAFEVVTELSAQRRRRGGGGGGGKLRGLALCQRASAYGVRTTTTAATMRGVVATLYVIAIKQGPSSSSSSRGVRVHVQRSYALDRLLDVSYDGSFDASFNVGAGGVLSVSFESHIQREMFLAAVQRLRSNSSSSTGDARALVAGGDGMTTAAAAAAARGHGDNGAVVTAVMSDALALRVEHDDDNKHGAAAARVRRARRERRHVYTAAEEQQLLRAMRGATLDDVRHFQDALLSQQKDAELASLDCLISCDAAWQVARQQVQERVHDVEDVEARIAQYAQHLLAKKDVIQQIEHDNNTLQQKQRNLEQLYHLVVGLRSQLSLDPAVVDALRRLATLARDDAAALTAFFESSLDTTAAATATTTTTTTTTATTTTTTTVAALLSSAMRHMQRVLRNRHLATDYAIAAVAQRRAYFLAQRLLIARRAHDYALTTIAAHERRYLADGARYSNACRVVWQLHSELHARLQAVATMLRALARLDVEAHTRVLRRYRASMQCVFALEIHHFFKQLRKHLRTTRTAWRPHHKHNNDDDDNDEHGALMLGVAAKTDAAMSLRRVTRSMSSAGSVATAAVVADSGGAAHAVALTTAPTPRLWWRDGRSDAPSPSPMLPQSSSSSSLQQQVSHTRDAAVSSQALLRVVLPSTAALPGSVELYADAAMLRGVRALAHTGSSTSSWLSSLRRAHGSRARSRSSSSSSNRQVREQPQRECNVDGDGRLRPDVAVAMALQASVTAVLQEEAVLARCFGLHSSSSHDDENDDDDDDDEVSDNDDGGRAQRRRQQAQQAQLLLRESLLELFGGDGDTTAMLLAQLHDAHVRTQQQQPQLYPATRSNSGRRSLTTTASHAIDDGGRHDDGDLPSLNAAADARALALQTEQQQQQLPSSSSSSLLSQPRSYVASELASFLAYVFDECDRLYALPVLCMVRAYRGHTDATTSSSCSQPPLLPTRSAFCHELLQPCEALASAAMARFVAEQTASITRCKNAYFVRPSALLPCFVNLPRLFVRLEAAYAPLAPRVACDRGSTYGAIATSLVDQCFAALEYSTDGSHAEAAVQSAGLSLPELFLRKLNATLDGAGGTKHSTFTRTIVQQLRHHAFFCAFYAALPPDSYAAPLLRDYAAASHTRRDRSEALYLTRVLLLHDFVLFGAFTLAAEDLALVYTPDELRLHRMFAPDAVRQVLAQLSKEMRAGVRASARRMRTHLLRDVALPLHGHRVAADGDGEAAFHCTLLQRTWQHFAQLLLQKYDFVAQLLTFAMYSGLTMPLSRDELVAMLAAN